MMTGECRDCLIDDGFDDQETMFVRIPLGRFKLASKAVSPCLGFTGPTHIDSRWDRWLDRLGDHARTMTIGSGSSKSWSIESVW
ncbi:hypothetical protein HMPREF0185_02319, partial [Brevundimonas diminuta 470-4]